MPFIKNEEGNIHKKQENQNLNKLLEQNYSNFKCYTNSQGTKMADILNNFCKQLLSTTAYFVLLSIVLTECIYNFAISNKRIFKLHKNNSLFVWLYYKENCVTVSCQSTFCTFTNLPFTNALNTAAISGLLLLLFISRFLIKSKKGSVMYSNIIVSVLFTYLLFFCCNSSSSSILPLLNNLGWSL